MVDPFILPLNQKAKGIWLPAGRELEQPSGLECQENVQAQQHIAAGRCGPALGQTDDVVLARNNFPLVPEGAQHGVCLVLCFIRELQVQEREHMIGADAAGFPQDGEKEFLVLR